MAADLIALNGVWRVFPRGSVAAVRGVSLSIRRGDHVAITGPSGSGKSTLLHLAGGLDRPTRGSVLFDGREPNSAAQWIPLRARRIGFVFQSFHLMPELTAAENVEIPMFGVVRRASVRRRRAAELLERVGLSHRAHHLAAELSGGECQRVAVARALANSPDAILADEPTGNLDSHTAQEVLNLLEDVRRAEGAALVVVTHDPGVSRRAARAISLLDGQIVADSSAGAPS